MKHQLPFNSIYRHGLVRVAVCVPHVKVADPSFNAERTIVMAQQASVEEASVALFPELGLSAYTNDDLFHQDALLDACRDAIQHVVEASYTLTPLIIVGAPLRFDGKLFNCAIAIHEGKNPWHYSKTLSTELS